MFLPVSPPFFSCADMTGAHPVTVSAGRSYETVSLTLKPPLLSTIISRTISEHLLLLHWNANPCSEYMLFSEATNHFYYKIYMHVYYIYTAFIHFFLKSHLCFAQMTQMRSSHCVVKKTYCVTWVFGGSKSSTWSCQMWGFRVVWITQYEMALLLEYL